MAGSDVDISLLSVDPTGVFGSFRYQYWKISVHDFLIEHMLLLHAILCVGSHQRYIGDLHAVQSDVCRSYCFGEFTRHLNAHAFLFLLHSTANLFEEKPRALSELKLSTLFLNVFLAHVPELRGHLDSVHRGAWM